MALIPGFLTLPLPAPSAKSMLQSSSAPHKPASPTDQRAHYPRFVIFRANSSDSITSRRALNILPKAHLSGLVAPPGHSSPFSDQVLQLNRFPKHRGESAEIETT